MCGVTGYLGTLMEPEALLLQRVGHMSNAIAHRGPNSAGAWCSAQHGVALGHRRLAIVDLSSAGHQPMFSASGRYVIAFNGEIYNHIRLREDLQKINGGA